ncbi:carboxypeptidase-like regulatory domain-containing protein [Jiulongibacter sediminis]|jgi:Fe(3+) dicitrate transport protein|uniref:carboxypeptidase-like regulatory domain-containing protein n=1 Tax=Jiulongibacter sediminis TaxID=1605367 RepID=UPI0026EEAAB0|nr:carboxypeptidase-like regulatory domain-containing protein [Jiulongibacter sediminis]
MTLSIINSHKGASFWGLLLLLLVLLSSLASAQNRSMVVGKVMLEGEPVNGATVLIKSVKKKTISKENGHFVLRDVPAGEYELILSHVGLIPTSLRFKHEGELTDLGVISLNADVNQLSEVSLRSKTLPEVQDLDPVKQDYLIRGKKTEAIDLKHIDADISQKNARQIFARIPGIFVYDMDGSGNQVNISSRGLDPHRSWEFNVRLDGSITNSDMYGYPASHFSMSMESVERIEMIHGTGALQYGAQFGGMLNYISKKGDSTRKIGFESINSIGSFGLKSTYSAIGGKVGKLQYYAYFSKRVSDGFRDDGSSDYESEYLNLEYAPSSRVKLEGGVARSVYTYGIPGPLTETQYLNNPRQSTRTRNFYSPDIFIPSFKVNVNLKNGGLLKWQTSAVLGERKSVQFTGISGVPDIQGDDGRWPARQVDIDNYHSYTSEFLYRQSYDFFGKGAQVNTGVRLIKNNLHRRQKGVSAIDFDAVYEVTQAGFGRDLNYYTDNVAVFAEQSVNLSEKLTLNTGLRVEKGLTQMRGRIRDYAENEVPNDISHYFPLLGVSFEYHINERSRFYGGWSQSYRPVIFADIIPANPYEKSDKNLSDAHGHTSELGFNGKSVDGKFRFSGNLFEMLYRNRMGKQVIQQNGETFVYRTNIGNSITYGLETYASFGTRFFRETNLSLFNSTSLMRGVYLNGQVTDGTRNVSIDGNLLQTVPQVISRSGVTLTGGKWSSTLLYSFTSSFYSDPLNTEFVENGTVGLVPSNAIIDWNSSIQFNKTLGARLSVNNVFDTSYFTKRPSGYPGPGIWPSDGRSVVLTLSVNL